MPTTSPYGRIFSFHRVEEYVLELAELRFEEYIRDTERQNGVEVGTFPMLRDWGWANEFDKWPEEHTPFLLAMYTGLADRPVRQGDGTYNTRILMGASIIVNTNSKAATRRAVHIYGAAFAAMILQHRSLNHPNDINETSWVDQRPAPLPSEADRSVGAMNMFFYVGVKNVVDERGKPPETPPVDPSTPPDQLPVIDSGDISITQKEIEP